MVSVRAALRGGIGSHIEVELPQLSVGLPSVPACLPAPAPALCMCAFVCGLHVCCVCVLCAVCVCACVLCCVLRARVCVW